MEDLSLHILDLAENSVTAGASLVEIRIIEKPGENRLVIEITDDGKGMDEEMARRARDPSVTTKKNKRFGLGLPFFADSAREAGGDLKIVSSPGTGTRILATMDYNHIDRKPLGDMVQTLMALIVGYPHVDFAYTHQKDNREFSFATWDLKGKTAQQGLSSAPAVSVLRKTLMEGEAGLK